MSSANESHDLYDLQHSLLPSTSYTLAYCLPLFFVSLALTLSGAFLVHDRTRTFKQHSYASADTEDRPKFSLSPSSFLHGGIGGIFSGYVFGVQLSTFLALVIPSTTSSTQLSANVFLAVWIIAAVACMPLGGRWKYAGMAMAAMSGFTSLALALSVIVHPALTVRIASAAVLVTLGIVGCMLPFPRVSLIFLRIACSAAGVLGLIVPIALLTHHQGWGNVWERLWTRDGIAWGDSREKGLSAGYCLFFLAGLACDTFLHKKIGENPDEKWDRFLENYTTTLPNDKRRAGTFAPSVSLWDRILGRDAYFAPVVDDSAIDPDHKVPINQFSPTRTTSQNSAVTFAEDLPGQKPPTQGFLRKKQPSSQGEKSSRRAVKFRPVDEEALYSSSDDDDDWPTVQKKTHAVSLSAASSSTLVASQSKYDFKPPAFPPEAPEYSDGEDIARVERPRSTRPGSPWKPAFIRQHSVRTSEAQVKRPKSLPREASPKIPSPSRHTPDPQARPAEGPGVVPATPSLLNAIKRINSAQEAAYGLQPTSNHPGIRPGGDKEWESFWADVKARASA